MASKPKTVASAGDKRMFFFSLLVFIGTVLLVGNNLLNRPAASNLEPSHLTVVAVVPGLDAAVNSQIQAINEQVAACGDYSAERRLQMQTHINWLFAPDTIPKDIRLALGGNPIGRLLFGMGSFTATEWHQRGEPADSCLLTIGKALNPLISQQGETPFDEFTS